MDKTPIQMAIDIMEKKMNKFIHPDSSIKANIRLSFFNAKQELENLLPYEKQWAEAMFNAGYKRGEDQQNVVDKVEGQVFPDFKTLYSKYEK